MKRKIKSIRKSCDDLWGRIVKLKYPKCVKCGKPSKNAHHIFNKGHNITRYMANNGIGLCIYCHTFAKFGFERDSHSEKNIYIIEHLIGRYFYRELDTFHREAMSFNIKELLAIEEQLEDELDNMETKSK